METLSGIKLPQLEILPEPERSEFERWLEDKRKTRPAGYYYLAQLAQFRDEKSKEEKCHF